jgi:hypothetical protein
VPDIKVGDIYDENEIGRKMQAWETRMRARGYYEARANQNASISEDGSVFLFLNLELGPMVRLVFEGDPLPGGEVDKLVPVRERPRLTRICSRTRRPRSRRICIPRAIAMRPRCIRARRVR